MPSCEHLKFQSQVRVGRLTDVENGPVTGYTADVRIQCVDCGVQFRFMGLPYGFHYGEPRLSADGTELRAPIEPALVVEICGQPLVSGRA